MQGDHVQLSMPYCDALGLKLDKADISIQDKHNRGNAEAVHRWYSYIQGFSAPFVRWAVDKFYRGTGTIYDPFAGNGTVMVEAQRLGLPAVGAEINPFMQWVAEVKLSSWGVSAEHLRAVYRRVRDYHGAFAPPPDTIKVRRMFAPDVLRALGHLQGQLCRFRPNDEEERQIRELLRLAFASLLVPSSRLHRAPSLSYAPRKHVAAETPYRLMDSAVATIAADLSELNAPKSRNRVMLADAVSYVPSESVSLVITSPPYANGMDYVQQYKIEMAFLGFAKREEMRVLRARSIPTDATPRGVIKGFRERAQAASSPHPFVAQVVDQMCENIARRGSYRRRDMPDVITKYFADMKTVLERIAQVLTPRGKVVMVLGDSRIADTYIPTDVFLAAIGRSVGLTPMHLYLVRERRSGPVRSFRLRESVLVMQKA